MRNDRRVNPQFHFPSRLAPSTPFLPAGVCFWLHLEPCCGSCCCSPCLFLVRPVRMEVCVAPSLLITSAPILPLPLYLSTPSPLKQPMWQPHRSYLTTCRSHTVGKWPKRLPANHTFSSKRSKLIWSQSQSFYFGHLHLYPPRYTSTPHI